MKPTRHHSFNVLLLGVIALHQFDMKSLIENTASCQIHAVMWFLNTKNLTAAKIHWQLCSVKGQL